MKKDIEWLKEKLNTEKYYRETNELKDKTTYGELYDRGVSDGINTALELVDQLDEPKKPVIPQFVADYIEENECLSLIYIGFKLFNNRIKDEDLNDWISNNQEQFCRAFLAWPNVEVEKEKKYRVRAGNRYVRFNLDGSIIGVKKDNSIVCLERLSKLPFDYKKAVESGIITLEEVTQ